MTNPYETLGLKSDATQDQIKKAYRNLAKKFHPDLNPGNKQAETRFKEINSAYEKIGEAEVRAKFDRGETEEQQAPPRGGAYRGQEEPYYYQTQGGGPGQGRGRYSQSFHGMDDDLFESIFGGAGGMGGARAKATKPRDERYQMTVDFKDAILGTEKEFSLPSGKRLRVKIPAGIESGKQLRFAGQAASGATTQDTPGGDVYVEIQVMPSPQFTRIGNDIEIELPISVTESLLGAEIKVPTLSGAVMMKIPPLVSTGQKLKISGKGVPGKGDQLVRLKIVNPSSRSHALSPELKTAIEAWAKEHPFDPRSENQAGGPS